MVVRTRRWDWGWFDQRRNASCYNERALVLELTLPPHRSLTMTLNSTTSRTRLYSLLLILSTTVLALSQAHPPLHAGREHHLAAAAAEHIVRPEDHHPYFDANSGRDDRVKVVRETVWLPRPTASASGNGEGGNDGGASSSSSSGAGGGFSGAPLNAGQGFQNKREPSAHILTSLRGTFPLIFASSRA